MAYLLRQVDTPVDPLNARRHPGQGDSLDQPAWISSWIVAGVPWLSRIRPDARKGDGQTASKCATSAHATSFGMVHH